MAAPATQMLTANRLRDGTVLYWKGEGWVLHLAEGEVFTDHSAAEAALAAARQDVTANRVVTPYLFEVRVQNGAVRPVKEREIIRAAGPTVRPDTGKQAAGYQAAGKRPAPFPATAGEVPAAALGAQAPAETASEAAKGGGGRDA